VKVAKVVPPPTPKVDVVPQPVDAAPDAGEVKVAEVPKPVDPPKNDPPKVPAKVARGKLTLDTTPYTEVFLKGRKLGDTPLVEVTLPPGIHVLTLVNDAKGIKRAIEVEISAGKTTTKKLKL
jgi:serine/threonine-protein kinase